MKLFRWLFAVIYDVFFLCFKGNGITLYHSSFDTPFPSRSLTANVPLIEVIIINILSLRHSAKLSHI